MKHYQFNAQIERDRDSGMYVAYVPSLPGAHTQAKSLDDLNINLKEVIELCLEELSDEELANLPEFVGMQQVMIDI
jgi:predicted RNase H-like HicB family nuclease